MQKKSSVLLNTLLAVTVTFNAFGIWFYFLRTNSLKESLEEECADVMASQEEKLGIKHFGTPDILVSTTSPALGWYQSHEDTIYLSLEQALTPESALTLAHELGHYYADKLHERLGKGDWPQYSDEKSANDVCIKIISEGIAEYFERCESYQSDDFKDEEWPQEHTEFWKDRVAYAGGYHLVKPIIDKHGKRGISYLIINTPKPDDLRNLGAYQERALDVLSQ